jgi:branched-subunit amino acid ABC-type transport system permease component
VLRLKSAASGSAELAGMSVYLLMAIVLLWRPEGLFGKRLGGDASPLQR